MTEALSPGESARAATRPAPVLFIGFVLLAAGVITAGYLYFLSYEAQYRAQKEGELSAVAELKAGELAEYRRERLAKSRQPGRRRGARTAAVLAGPSPDTLPV